MCTDHWTDYVMPLAIGLSCFKLPRGKGCSKGAVRLKAPSSAPKNSYLSGAFA